MERTYLFSPVFRKIGYGLMAAGLLLFVVMFIVGVHFDPEWEITLPVFSLTRGMYEWDMENAWYPHVMDDEVSFELTMILMCVGCVFVAFSKEKDEDECIAQMRMNSLVWSLLWGMVLVVVSTMFIFGGAYLICLSIYPILTFLLFIIKYNVSLYKFRHNND